MECKQPIPTVTKDTERLCGPSWVFRLTVYGLNNECLPLFVTVKKGKRGITARIESDQTDFSDKTMTVNNRSAELKGLSFWTDPK
jgi:hypothetical protein